MEITTHVLTSKQTLSTDQQHQARKNVQAVGAVKVDGSTTISPDPNNNDIVDLSGAFDTIQNAIENVRQVPTVQSSDNGKVLGVTDANGSIGWVEPQVVSQVNADWTATEGVAEILHKPDLNIYAKAADLSSVATSGSYNDLEDKPDLTGYAVKSEMSVTAGSGADVDKTTIQLKSGISATVLTTHQDVTGKADKVANATVGNLASLDSNGNLSDSGVASANLVHDGSYVHTDNNFSNADKTKLDGIASGAEVNIQSDWNQTDDTADDFIKNKPEIPAAQVKADWNASGTVAEILNKPTIPTVDQAFDATSTNAQSGVAVSGAVSGKYEKPSGGIPATDLESAVQTSLGKSDSAIQGVKVNHSLLTPDANKVVDVVVDEVPTVTSTDNGKVLKASYNNGVASYAWQSEGGGSQSVVDQHYSASSTNAQSGTAVAEAIGTVRQVPSTQSSDENKVLGVTDANGTLGWVTPAASQVNADWNATSGAAEILNKPNLSTVATTGAYTDLSGTPDLSNYVTDASYVHTDNNYTNADQNKLAGIAAGAEVNVQSDWNQTDDTADDFIKNKPTIPSFNQTQMDAINSGITSAKVDGYDRHVSDTDVHVTTSDKTAWNAKYDKPSGGIPKADMAESVQTSLGKADTALQSHQDISGKADKSEMSVVAGTGTDADKTTITLKSGTSATVLTSHQDISGKQDVISDLSDIRSGASAGATAVQPGALATVATSGSYSDLSNKPTIPAAQVNSDWNASSGVAQILNKPSLATVATTGSYNDLSNKPSIPAAQVNSDWDASSGVAQILNKPSIPSVDQSYGASSTNAQSGTAVAEAVAAVRQVPSTQSSDNGKVLGVTDTSGSLGWVDQPADELPSITGNGGKVLKVNAGATAVEWDDETDTTYESKTAAESGTDVSLVTTGEKYTWNHKQDALSFDGTYNASSNKVATESTVSSAVQALDAEVTSSDGTNVQVKVTEANGKVTAVNITTDNTESKSNKKQSIDSTSETEYPSSKAVANFVNSSVATATARFLGSFTLTNLGLSYGATNAQIATALDNHTWPSGTTPTNNDYVYVEIQDPQTTGIDDEVRRFKFNGTVWAYEYTLNNSSFTAAEKAAIDSGITATAVSNYNTHIDDTDIHVTSSDKSDWNAKYDLPSGGIPSTDLSSDVQTSLGKADTALQSHQDISGKADKVSGATSGNFAALDGNGNLVDSNSKASDFATSAQGTKADSAIQGIKVNGSSQSPDANKVINITVPAAQVNSDWNASSGVAEILNKPNLGLYAEKSEMSVTAGTGTDADKTTIQLKTGLTATVLTAHQDISGKQDTISDLQTIREGASAGATAYQKPSGGIPDTDLSSSVQTSLGKADSAYQLPSGGIPDTDLSSGVQASLDKADTALQSHQDISGKADKVSGATTGNFAGLDANGNITDSGSKAGDFATTAQGAKADSAIQSVKVNGSALTPDANKAVDITVPAAQVKSDWNSSSGLSEILNKPDLSVYALKSEMSVTAGTGTDADKTTITLKSGTAATVLTTHQDITGKQDVISDLSTIRSGAEAGATAYQKPSGGIPDTDLSSAVQESLGKADTALQSHQDISGKADKVSGATNGNFAGLDSNGNLTDSGSKASDFATAAQGAKADSAVQPGNLATVATSGSYSDLSNKPSIPTVDQSYSSSSTNAQSGTAVASAISNKQDTLAFDGTYNASDNKVATVSTVTNAVSGKADKSEMSVTAGTGTDADKTTIQLKTGLTATVLTAHQDISGKQDTISDLQTIREGASAGATAYQKPSGGIPDTDLSSSVQASLEKADTALQSHQDISGKADKVSGATNGNFAGLDSNGNLTDSGSKAGDFATAAQGGKADTAVQPGDLATVATSGSYTDLSNTPDIPTVDQTYDGTSANAQSGVAVASAISDKADKVSSATNGNFAGLDGNGNLTDSGSKASDFATAAQGAKADSAYQKPSGGIPDTDLSSGVQASLGKADTAVQPGDLATVATSGSYTDLSNTPDLSGYALSSSLATVATSGDYNDLDNLPTIPTVDQSYDASSANAQSGVAVASAISDKADKVSGATNGNFAGLDSNGNLTDSGSKASDFATSAQGAKADSAYQLPSGGMPSTDMASAVQTSLGKADSAIQGVKVNSTALTPDANHIVDITINNATVTIDMAGTASSPNRSVGSFTVDQSAASTITIPTAVSAIPEVFDQNNEVVTAAVPAQPGVLSSGDKEKLDGLFNVTGSSTIAIDPSTHAVSSIVGPDGGVVAGASGLIVQPDLVSRVVYVGADCVYNDKTFWSDSTTVDGIIDDYANQTVTDYRGNGVPLARFVAEYDSNRYRIANIDETPGTVEYNRKIGGQIIDLMRSDFWMSSHPTYDIIKFDKDMDELFDLLMTGSPMNAYLLLNNMTSTAFITDARREMYMDMIKAYDAWPYADKDTAYADFMAEHALDRFVQVSTTWPLNSWNSYRYVMAGTKTATDKVIFVIRHAERGDDTSVNGDINSTGVTTCTTMGEQARNNASWTSNNVTYTIDNFPANDATYYSTEYLRCKHSAQAFAAARLDTDFAASDYSGITVEVELLNQYRFFYQPASSGNSTLIRKYSVNPSQLTSTELQTNFGVSTASEAETKLANDYVQVCKEILNKSTARLNMFYTHDYFTLPLAVMASNKYYTFSGSGTDNRNWINYCAGIGMILHPDNTYEVMPVRGKSNGTMTI